VLASLDVPSYPVAGRLDVRFGVAIDFGAIGWRATPSFGDHFAECLELAIRSEELGFESLWLGESYPSDGTSFHLPDPFLALAALSQTVKRMRLGTGVLLLPAWNPLRLAYEGALVDQLSNGRLVVGIGLGRPALRRRFRETNGKLGQWADEALALLKALWSGDADFKGSLITAGGPIYPLPVQENGPPLLVGGAVLESAERAARYGDGYYSGSTHPLSLIPDLAAHYRQARESNGADPAGGSVVINRLTLVTEDSAAAHAQAIKMLAPVLERYASMGSLRASETLAEPDSQPYDALESEFCLVGDPDEVCRKIEAYQAAGVTDIQVRVRPGATDAATALKSIELIAGHVMPRFAELASS
jgi:alkanesulfonate monooxygenase SsuD/methylene tetrahydromethanopterin reductase-like flavin-dependent oxidoreductase (luciferase family)